MPQATTSHRGRAPGLDLPWKSCLQGHCNLYQVMQAVKAPLVGRLPSVATLLLGAYPFWAGTHVTACPEQTFYTQALLTKGLHLL